MENKNKNILITLTGEIIKSENAHLESLNKVIAEKKEMQDKDLMYLKFRYVHEGANGNSDVFIADELKDRHPTAIYKPLNMEHKETRIVGVIYDTEYFDREQSDNGKAGVNIYAVMYKWLFPVDAEEINERYNNNDLSVSMETWFDNAECSICNKSFAEESQYCEHLSSRYAVAEYKRILHGITFGGVGIVKRPADSDAVALALAEESEKASLKSKVEKRMELQKFDAIMYEAQNIMYNLVHEPMDEDNSDEESPRSKKQKLNQLLSELKALIDTINVNKMVKGEKQIMELDANTVVSALLEKAKADNEEAFKTQFNEEISNITSGFESKIASLTEELNTVKAEKETLFNEFNTFKTSIANEKLLATRKSILTQNEIEFEGVEDVDAVLLDMNDKIFDMFVNAKVAKKKKDMEKDSSCGTDTGNATASLEINDADANAATQSTDKVDILTVINKL